MHGKWDSGHLRREACLYAFRSHHTRRGLPTADERQPVPPVRNGSVDMSSAKRLSAGASDRSRFTNTDLNSSVGRFAGAIGGQINGI
jgi:hypothetical protein